jgi:uncharacterized protein YjlB
MERLLIIKHFLSPDFTFPNNEYLPLMLYKDALTLEYSDELNAIYIEKLFRKNDWKNSWRDGIYDYHHYHSNAHEAMGVFRGSAKIQAGGPNGVMLDLTKGDVIIIPAGVAHKSLHASSDFKCVGAYPSGQEYDMKYGEPGEKQQSLINIASTPLPTCDPVFGKQGPLEKWWVAHEKLKVVNH